MYFTSWTPTEDGGQGVCRRKRTRVFAVISPTAWNLTKHFKTHITALFLLFIVFMFNCTDLSGSHIHVNFCRMTLTCFCLQKHQLSSWSWLLPPSSPESSLPPGVLPYDQNLFPLNTKRETEGSWREDRPHGCRLYKTSERMLRKIQFPRKKPSNTEIWLWWHNNITSVTTDIHTQNNLFIIRC